MSEKPIEVTIHARYPMAVELQDALGKLVEAAVKQFTKPDACPRCGADDFIPPTSKWPAWTCEPCGWDTRDAAPPPGAASAAAVEEE